MNYLRFFSYTLGLIFFTAGLFSCKKNDEQIKEGPTITAKLNGSPIELVAHIVRLPSDSRIWAYFRYLDADGNPRFEFDVDQIQPRTGSYEVARDWPQQDTVAQGRLSTLDIDHALDEYDAFSPSTFTIDTIDLVQRTIRCSFNLNFVFQPLFGDKEDGFPDTLHITAEQFLLPFSN